MGGGELYIMFKILIIFFSSRVLLKERGTYFEKRMNEAIKIRDIMKAFGKSLGKGCNIYWSYLPFLPHIQ